jgi:tetratricopeptide (TPR) repeat protein
MGAAIKKSLWLFPFIILTGLVMSSHSKADDWAACDADVPDVIVFGCSAIINSGNEPKAKLAIAYIYRGIAYYRKDDYESSITDFGKAIALNPKEPLAHFNRGISYAAKGNLPQAIIEYSKAIKMNPKHVNSYINRGAAYFYLGKKEEALNDYRKALDLKPDDADAIKGLQSLGQ